MGDGPAMFKAGDPHLCSKVTCFCCPLRHIQSSHPVSGSSHVFLAVFWGTLQVFENLRLALFFRVFFLAGRGPELIYNTLEAKSAGPSASGISDTRGLVGTSPAGQHGGCPKVAKQQKPITATP